MLKNIIRSNAYVIPTKNLLAEEEVGTWIVDHMAKDQSIFKVIDKLINIKVWLGNDNIVESRGKGTVMVDTKKGTKFIKDVLLVQENLLSIGQMMENGYSLHFEKDTCKIYDNRIIEIGQVKMEKRNRSFPISFKPRTNIAMKVEVGDSWL